jgi:hypothetical protein
LEVSLCCSSGASTVGGGVDDDMVVDKLELEKEDAECGGG